MSMDDEQSITGTALKQILLNFLPREFIKNVDLSKLVSSCPEVIPKNGLELLQKLVKVSNDDIRLFGTTEGLADSLCFHRHFTSSHRLFGIDISEEYNYEPQLLENENGASFICKQDLLVQLESFIFERYENILDYRLARLVRSVVSIFLKTHEERLKECCEYIKYDSTFPEDFFAKVNVFGSFSFASILGTTSNNLSAFNFEEIFNEWKSWIPGWTDEQYEPVRKALQTHFDKYPFYDKFYDYNISYVICKKWLEALQTTIDAHPQFFLPATPASIQLAPITVRVFFLIETKFVMKSELFKAFKLSNPGSSEWDYTDPDGYVRVIDFDDVKKHYGSLISEIEFLYCPRRIPTARPVPIMTPTGDFCIPASDAFQEIAKHLSLVLKVFQKIKKDSWHLMENYMKWLGDELTIDAMSPDFVTISKMDHIEKYTSEFFKQLENKPAKSIRNVRKCGFTLNDLKKELRVLGLMDVLPDIDDYAESVYTLMKKSKSTRFLGTHELINAVGQCQFKYIIQMFPKVFLNSRYINHESSGSEDDKPTPKTVSSLTKEPEKRVQPVERTGKPSSVISAKDDSERVISEKSEVNESNPHDKDHSLLETSEVSMLNKTLKEKNKLLDEKIDRKTEENEQLKRKNADLRNSLKDYESLKAKLSKYENNETKRKDSNARLNESNQQLTKLVSTLESQLKDEQRKVQKVERSSKQAEIDFNKEIKRVKREFSENNKNVVAIKTELDSLADFNSQCVKTNAEHLSRIEALERDFDDNKGIIEFLQREVSTKTDQINIEEAKHARTIAEFNDTKHEIEEKINQLELLLEKEKQRTQELAQGMVPQLQKLAGGQIDLDLEQEIFDIKSANNQLQDTNTRLAVQVEQQTLIIKAFFEHVGHIEKSYSSSSSQTTPEEFTTGYTGVKHHLWSLQKIKDSFRNGKQLKQAKDMVEKLITLCNNQPDIHEMINYEFQQYEAQLHHYLQSIEVNIQKIKKTGECTHLDPIPNLPMFSDRFLKEYWKHISESEVSENSPKDSECLICLVEMTLEEKTMKCENCRKVLHLECASEWLKRHRSCPHCRRELLDPNEFPPLL